MAKVPNCTIKNPKDPVESQTEIPYLYRVLLLIKLPTLSNIFAN